jgi:hypothetical protein
VRLFQEVSLFAAAAVMADTQLDFMSTINDAPPNEAFPAVA